MFEGWEDYYLLVGSAAAALIGLLFVVVTLTAGRERRSVEAGARYYMTPIVFDLGAIVVMSGAAMSPVITEARFGWLTLAFAALSAVGDARIAYGIRHLPEGVTGGWFDVWWYGIIPAALSLLLAASGIAMLMHSGWAAAAIAGLLMALLLICIHNAWDLVTYLAPK